MSIHKHSRDLRWGLSGSTYLYSPLVFDPVIFPLFSAMFAGGTFTIAGSSTTLVSLAAALATTGITSGVIIR